MWYTTKSIMAFSCPSPKLDKYYVWMNSPSWVVPLGCHKKEKDWPWIAVMLSHLYFRVYISTEHVRDSGKSNYTKEKKEVKATQSCLTLCDPMAYEVDGILQARILEWIAFPFSRGSSQPRDWTQVSRIAGGFFTSWATREAQEY